MKLFEFGVQSAAYAPALAVADLSGAAVLRTAEPMAIPAFAVAARAPRIRFAAAASVIGSVDRTRHR